MNIEKLEHLYFDAKHVLQDDLSDEEFLDWLECEDCDLSDYEALIAVLEDEEYYERVDITLNYINSLRND